MTLYGTGKCFSDAFEIALELMRDLNANSDEIILVHALITTDQIPRFAHGWTEFRGLCFERAVNEAGEQKLLVKPSAKYYSKFTEHERREYKFDRVFWLALSWRNDIGAGPWYRPFQLACKEHHPYGHGKPADTLHERPVRG